MGSASLFLGHAVSIAPPLPDYGRFATGQLFNVISVNYYNHIAPIYDQTRWMTDGVADEVADCILGLVDADPQTSFLEPGVGTGLNVLPFVKRGYAVTGVDISPEMLDQFRQKLPNMPENLTLMQADASQLPFADASFDVVLTVHMIHTVANWNVFLNEVERVLKPHGFYLRAQWVTPPARLEFEQSFKRILAKYEDPQGSDGVNNPLEITSIADYWHRQGYQSRYIVAKEWTVSNTVAELLNCLQLRAYGLCWRTSEETYQHALAEFRDVCLRVYGSYSAELSSQAKFEIWAYTLQV